MAENKEGEHIERLVQFEKKSKIRKYILSTTYFTVSYIYIGF